MNERQNSEQEGGALHLTDEPSRCIGKYEIIELLGKGAMGAVYRAHDPILDRDVALKVMLPQIADDPEQKLRFEREARAVARMMHPNVVTVFDLGYHTDGSPYIVMEMLRGRDLFQSLRDGPPLSLEAKISSVLQGLEGLGHAHRVGIVHRDIKPANLFITDDGVTKIMDFGIARLASSTATAAGVVFGTANYMSPEQVLGGPLDGRSDLFSVGCMLCELLSGHRPFEADSVMTTLYKIAHDEPTLELPAGPEFEGLLPVLKRVLAKKADERFATAAELASALKDFQKRLSAPASRSTTPPTILRAPRAQDTTQDSKASAPAATPTVEIERPRADPTQLFRLLREIYVGSRSGHLHFTHGSERRSLRILKGQIIHGSCDVSGEHLGDVAVRYGLLSQADLERAVAIVLRDRKRLGIVLCERGLWDPAQLEEAVGLHVRELLFNVLDRPGGSHVFEDVAEADLEGDLGSKLSTGELILEATRRVQDPALVRRALGDMNRILELSTNSLLRAQKIALTPTDGFILSRIDRTTSAREIIGLIPLPPEDTERSLLGLLCTGTVDYRPEPIRTRPSLPALDSSRIAARPPAGDPPRLNPVSSRPPRTAAEEPQREARDAPARATAQVRQMILEASEGLQRKDHFEALGLTSTATEGVVREAYMRFVRLLHPDACRDASLSDLCAQREAVFVRICEAYETLRSPDLRATYEPELEMRKPRRFRAAPSPPAQAPPSLAASPSAPSGPPLPAKAPNPPADEPSAESLDAPEAIRSAEQLITDERYWDAIQQLERVIPHVHGPVRHRASVALARASMKNPKWVKQADDLLQSVIRENPGFVEAYVALGTLYRDGRLVTRAAAMYRKALELDPTHPEARQELASLDKCESPHRAGLLKGLFGKIYRAA